jgi:vacuolar-type H+-ATPase subunit C/Vma6
MRAQLKFPVLGYVEIRLIEKHNLKWLAELIGAGLTIEVYEDEFVLE